MIGHPRYRILARLILCEQKGAYDGSLGTTSLNGDGKVNKSARLCLKGVARATCGRNGCNLPVWRATSSVRGLHLGVVAQWPLYSLRLRLKGLRWLPTMPCRLLLWQLPAGLPSDIGMVLLLRRERVYLPDMPDAVPAEPLPVHGLHWDLLRPHSGHKMGDLGRQSLREGIGPVPIPPQHRGRLPAQAFISQTPFRDGGGADATVLMATSD
jgi:hypothetical protein